MSADNVLNQTIYNNITQNATTTDGTMTHPHDVAGTIWNYFFGMLLLLCMYFCCKSAPTQYLDDETRNRRLLRLARRMRQLEEEPKGRIQTDLTYRNEMILKSLIIQKVICSNDENGNVILGNDSDDAEDGVTNDESGFSKANTNATNNESDDSCCCAICLEPYQVGDVVAWSRHSHNENKDLDERCGNDSNKNTSGNGCQQNPLSECLHVFHQDCIIQWLQNIRHDDCPSCRAVILRAPADEDSEDPLEQDIETRVIQESEENKTTNQDDLTVLLSGNGTSFDTDDESVCERDTPNVNTTRSMFMIVQGLVTKVITSGNNDNRNSAKLHSQRDDKKDNPIRFRKNHFADEDYILMEQGSSDQEDTNVGVHDVAGMNPTTTTYPFRQAFSFGSCRKLVSSYLVGSQKLIDNSLPTKRPAPAKHHACPAVEKASLISVQLSGQDHQARAQTNACKTESGHAMQRIETIPFRRIVSAGPGTPVTSLSPVHCLERLDLCHSTNEEKQIPKTAKQDVVKFRLSSSEISGDCSDIDDEEDDIVHLTG